MEMDYASVGAAYEKALNPEAEVKEVQPEQPAEQVVTEPVQQDEQVVEEKEQVAETETPQEQPQFETYTIKVNGKEKVVNRDELISLAQKGDDYSYRMEQLKAKALEFDALTPIAEALKTNPEFRAYIAQFGKTQPPTQQPQAADDPVEQFKREIIAEALREIQPKVEQPLQQIQAQNQSAQILARVQIDDPDGAVRQEMQSYVDSLPGHIEFVTLPNGQKRIDPARSFGAKLREYMVLDSNPQEFMATYARCKEAVISRKSQAKTSPASANTTTRTVSTKAPVLEGAGAEVKDSSAATAKQRRQELRNRALSGDLAAAGALYDMISTR